MNTSSHHHRRRRLHVAAGFVLTLASLSGIAGAVEFDERIKAPLMKDAGALRTQAQSYSARFAALGDAGPQQLITNRVLAGERFDLSWQIQQSIDVRRPLGDLSALGFVDRGDGTFFIDLRAHPQWNQMDKTFVALLPITHWDAFSKQLVARGVPAADTAKLRDYVATHDIRAAINSRTLPVSLSFGRLVKKLDKMKRPVPEATVLSYVYQRAKAESEASREWMAGLLASVDAQSARILISALAEGELTSIWAPDDQAAGIADILAKTRQPDFEARAIAAAKGEAP
jgi:hypothetical protein